MDLVNQRFTTKRNLQTTYGPLNDFSAVFVKKSNAIAGLTGTRFLKLL